MAEIDSLEIKIKSEATTALQSLNKLISKIDTLSGALNKINVGNISSQMSKLTSAFKDINIKGFSEINQSVRETGKSMKKLSDEAKKVSKVKFTFDASDYEKTIKKLQSKFSEAGKGFKVSGNLDQMQKEADKLSASLEKLFGKQEKIISVGKMSPENATFQNLQYDIAEATNKLAKFQNAISNFKMPEKGSFEQRNPKFSLPETSINTKPLEYFRNSLEDINSMMQKVVTQSNIDNFVSSLETDLGRLKKAFPEQIQLIEDYKNKIESLRNPEINTDKAFKGISDAAKYSTEQSQKSLKEALEENAQKAKTLRERLKQLQVPPIKEENLEKLSNMLSKAKEKMATLKAELANKLLMGEVTESEDDKKYVKMRKEIALTGKTIDALQNKIKSIKSIKIAGFEEAAQKTKSLGNKVDVLKAKLEQLKSQGLNFGDKEFDKAYSKLNKAEAELKEYKTNLEGAGNASSRFASTSIPNFKKVTNVIGKMGSGISSAAKKIVNLSVPFNSVSASSDGLAKKLGKLFIVFQSFRGLGDIIGKSIDLSSDLTEQQNAIDVSFDKYKKSIEDLAKVSVPQFGMSELTAKTIAGRFQSMGVAIGYSQKQMSGMSVELTKLAADMASFYNVEQADVAKSLESVFTGTTEPMRRYGIDLTQATLEEWAHKQGVDAKMKSMSQAEKTMLRYQYVLANTSAAQGDFARTSGSWANQTRILMQSFQQLGTIVGGVLINALKPLVKGLNVVMQQVISFAKVISDALGHIFGWTYEEGGGITDDFAGGVDGAGDLADGMGDVADATDDATKKQKEFNKQLAKFDELNNYTTSKGGKDKDKDDGGGTSLDDLAGLGGAAAGKWVETDSILKKFKSDIDSLYELGEYIGNALTKAMESISWDSVYEEARNFGSGLASFLNGLISPELFYALGKTVTGGINTAINAALGFGENFNFDNFGTSIASFINSSLGGIDWGTALTAATTWGTGIATAINSFIKETDFDIVGSSVASFIDTAVQGALSFTKNFNFKGVGKSIATALNSFIKKTDFNDIGKLIASFVNGVAKTALSLAKNFNFKGVGKSIATFINSSLGNIQWKTILTAASAWGKGISQVINSFFKETDFKLIGSTVGNFINTAINSALSSGKELNFSNIGQKIADGINKAFETINFTGLAEIINTWVKGALTAVTTLLQKTDFEAIGQKIGTFLAELDILSMMGKFAQMLWEAIKSGFSLLGGLIQEAPLETALIAAFAAFKFLGVGSIIASGISSALVSNLATKLGTAMTADSTIQSVMSEALSAKLAPALQTVTDKIGAIVPAIGTAVAGFAEFNVVSGAFEDLATGTGNFIVKIGEIAGAVGAAAAAMTAAFGFPAGVIAAAITGIIGAIKGINDAFEEIKAEETGNIIKNALTNPGGTPISDLTEKASSDIEEIGNAFSVVNTKSQELENAEGNISKLVFEIDKIKTSIDAGVISTEEGVKKLNDAYESLADAINVKIGAAGDVLLDVFGSDGASAKAFETAGLNSDEMKKKVVSSMDETQKQVFSLTEELKKLRETDPTSQKIPELEQQLKDLARGTSETDKALDDLAVQLDTNKLNWEDYLNEEGFDTTKLQNGLDTMAKSVGNAKDTIKEDTGKILDAARGLGDEEIYNEVKSALPDTLDYMNSQVDSKVLETTDAIQNDLIGGMNKIVDDAKAEWNNKNWFEKFFSGGSEASYVKSALEDYKKNYIEPATSQIETSMSEVGVEGAGWASDAAEDIINSLFTTQISRDFNQTTTVLKDDWKSVLDDVTKKVKKDAEGSGKEVGKAVSDGYADGIDAKKAEKAGKEVGDASIKGTKKSVDSNSPSKVYKSIGGDVVDGFVLGLNTSWKKVESWWKKAEMPKVEFKIGNIKDKVSAKWKEVIEWWGQKELSIDSKFLTKKENVNSWWEKIKEWWGTEKKLNISNSLKTTKENISLWWKKIKEWWGTKKLEVSNSFKTLQSDVGKWWDSIKKWWGTKKLEVSNKFTTQKNEVTSWWTDKVKSWWGERKVKVSTEYTTKETTVNSWGKNTVKWLKEGISGAWGDFSEWVVKKIKSVVNQVVKGLNWVLKEVGSNKRIAQYAKGSNGLPQDTVGLVNDQKGNTYREMIIPPHSKPFIPKGRNVTLPMEKGTKIMPATKTKEFLQGMKNLPHFARGTENFKGNIFDYFDNPRGIIQIATDKFIDFSGLAKASLSISKGIVNALQEGSVNYIKKVFDSTGGAGIERAINWALNIASDNAHGYDQNNRWGNPDYDCSSFVITAFEQAGIKLKSAGATYTGDMRGAALKTGFSDVTKSVNLSNGGGLKRGDILLDAGRHVALYLGGGQLVHASINENGTITGGQPGDQTGKEITTRGYYNHPWSSILRYTGKSGNNYANGIGNINITDIIKGYAKGGFVKDTLGVVNDQKGNTYKELIIPPHGTPFIPDGRDVMLAMQKGTKVIPAGKTKRLIENLPHFANGTEVNLSSDNSKNANKTGLGIAGGVSQAINDTLIPYIREMIRILQDNASNGGSSKKKTTTKYADTVKEIQAAWTGLAKWFESTVVEPITKGFNAMKEELAKVFDNTNEELTQKYTEISTEWQGVLTEIPGWIKENVNDVITSNFTDFCSEIAEGIKTTWGNVQDVLSPMPGWIESDVTNPIKESFTGIFSDVETGHTTMWDIMSTYASGKVDWITAITEAAFTRFSYLISEFENKLDALDRDISATESAISRTADKINETKKQLEDTQNMANGLGVNTGSSTQSKTFSSKIQDASITEAFAKIPKAASQFVQASTQNTISRLEETLKKRARFGRYAAGGFPEDGWFRASHGEIMGQFDNGQSVVANNQQITSGIANAVYPAVYNAMMAAMASSGGNGGDIVVQIDGENVFRVVRDKDNDFYKRNHRGAFEH